MKQFNLDYSYFAIINIALENMGISVVILAAIGFLVYRYYPKFHTQSYDLVLESECIDYVMLLEFVKNLKINAKIESLKSGRSYFSVGTFSVNYQARFTVCGYKTTKISEVIQEKNKITKTETRRFVGISFQSGLTSTEFHEYLFKVNASFIKGKIITKFHEVSHTDDFSSDLLNCDEISNEELEKIYIKPFFNQNFQQIWNTCKNISSGKSFLKSAGFMLYGPPGTGKSKIPVTIANALKLNVWSVNLKDISLNHLKRFLYQKNVVIIIDEFDSFFDYIKNKKIEKKRIHEIEKLAAKKENLITEESKKDICDFEFKDLISVIDGPMIYNNRFIFATTNYYETICGDAPSLFRPGRLTPIKIDYLDDKTYQDFILYHTGKETKDPSPRKPYFELF